MKLLGLINSVMTLEGLGRTKQNAAQSAEHAAGFIQYARGTASTLGHGENDILDFGIGGD